MTYTNFPNGITSMGIPVLGGGLPATKGKIYFVDYGAGGDSNPGTSIDKPLKTIAKAYSLVTSNNDDVIALIGSSTHVLTEMLDVSKNRVHFIGLDCSNGRYYGQNAKVSLGVTTAATDIGTIKNTGIRNTFTNIKFLNSNTVAQGIYCFVEAGEYTLVDNCEIYKETDLDETAAAELVMNGDSSIFRNCTIGSNAKDISGAVIRANVLVTKGIVAGKACRDSMFENCLFWKKASNVANRFVYGANATDVERMLLFKNCLFFSTKLSAAAPAQCVEFGAEQTEGYCLLDGCTSIGNTKLSTTTGVYIQGVVPTYATSGIAVAS